MALSNKLTYHRRLFLGLVVYSWILVGCFAVFQYYREKEFKAEELNGRLQLVNDRLLDELDRNGSLAAVAKDLGNAFDGLRISVIDYGGNVIYDNTLDSLPVSSNHLGREEIKKALAHGEGFAIHRHSELTDASYFYSAKKGERYIARSAVPYTMSLAGLLAADYTFLWAMFSITVVMCVVGYFATRKVGVHVARLNKFAERVERGERIFDTEPFPHDELGEISSHIIRLYARLQQALADRDREHQAAMREEREKIRIKRRLTNNINHELKTPVASMRLCLETLLEHEDMPDEKRREFIERCYAANERLSRLLADVSAITRLEDGSDSIVRENVDLSSVAAEVCNEFLPIAKDKGIEIVNGIDYSKPLQGNASLIGSIFRNLIANALAYSGCSKVELSQSEDDDYVTIVVQDDGIGVAPEHLPRLFERFYRIDKGRSRQSGGTGLGLSIVKNAVIWHGGRISVENRRGGGLKFVFTLSKNHS